jgi:hypothetical protein
MSPFVHSTYLPFSTLCTKYCHHNFLFDVYFRTKLHVSTACCHLQAIRVIKCKRQAFVNNRGLSFTLIKVQCTVTVQLLINNCKIGISVIHRTLPFTYLYKNGLKMTACRRNM